ncbi:MAG: alpha/beta hydrolase [Pseudomonadota bacterium]
MQQSVKAILKRMFFSILFIMIGGWLGLTALLYFYQASFIFHPNGNVVVTPDKLSLDFEDVYLTTKDNQKINGWWVPHPEPRFTLLFLHGNAGNISHRLDTLKLFHDLGLSVLIIDYRGYGNSTGNISEQGTYIDANTAWQYLTNKMKIKPDEIIIFGRSLGGGVASWLAKNYNSAGVILESTFTSIADMGKHYYPYMPVKLINHIKFDSYSRITKINAPLLFIHSQSDEIVPFEFGRSLFEKANEPKSFLQISGNHNYGFQQSRGIYVSGLNNFLTELQSQ